MPIIRLTLIEGYDEATIARLAGRLTDAVRATLAAPPDGVVVAVDELKPGRYLRGGAARAPGPALPGFAEVARAYLEAFEARDLDTARGFLAEGFRMVFPGGRSFTDFAPLIEWSRTRYARVGKRFESFDECLSGPRPVVWCKGTLWGTWTDGTPFEGIRFTDRFEFEGGRIVFQEVWNDLAVHRPQPL
jgi:phenylpyruvate tautomerase PptA (4-oxalocrotonate tautomerase family)